MEQQQLEYLRYDKYMMCVIGQWPHLTILERVVITSIFTPIIMIQTILQGGGLVGAFQHSDMDLFMEGFAPFIISLMCLCKFINCIVKYVEMKDLLDVMQEDWKIYSKISQECKLLRENYAVAKRVTIRYAASVYGTMTTFLVVPTVLTAADAMGFYNISGDRPLAFRVDYFVDANKYYYALLIHSYFGTLGFVTVVVGIDCMTLFYVQHECALCEILGRRLAGFHEDNDRNVNLHPEKHEDRAYQNVKICVVLHQHILAYGRKLEDAHNMTMLFQLGLSVLGISFLIFQTVMHIGQPNQALRYLVFTICILSIALLGSWPGQQLSDHSERIFEYATSGKWYLSSINARKLINIMLLRSLTPIKMTAGKLFVLNLLNFSSVVRTSFSYFTALCSFQ